MRRVVLLLGAVAVVVAAGAVLLLARFGGGGRSDDAGEARWVVTDLGTLGGRASQANAINDRGQVVGWSVNAKGKLRAFVWQKGRMTDLGTLAGDFTITSANAINSRGQVVGNSEKIVPMGNTEGTVRSLAFLWEDGRMTDLGSLGGKVTWARAINQRGQIIGSSSRSFLWQKGRMTDLYPVSAAALNDGGEIVGQMVVDGASHAALWRNGEMSDLGTLPGQDGGPYGVSSEAVAINARGQVVGTSTPSGGSDDAHAFLWEKGRMVDLGTLGGKSSTARAINGQGQIIGYSTTTTDLVRSGWITRHAFLWQNGKMTDLGTLGGRWSEAVAINEQGQIIGQSETALGGEHAFVWEKGTMTDLGGLGVTAINNRSQIIGTAQHAVLWTLKQG